MDHSMDVSVGYLDRFQRLAGVTTLLAIPCSLGSIFFLMAAVGGQNELLMQGALVGIGSRGAEWFRWGNLLDLFGYYLLLAPLALYLHERFKSQGGPFVTLYTLCGLAYILIGAIGAILLAAVGPTLIREYALAQASQRATLQVVFDSFYRLVYSGLWNPLEILLEGIWLVGMGATVRHERRRLGLLTTGIGCLGLLQALGSILDNPLIFQVGFAGLVFLPLVWMPGWAIQLLKKGP
jgi:hypothetical protein